MPMSPRLLRPRASGATHPEALDWATRVTANGGTVSSTTLAAVSKFCVDIQAAGLRDRFYRLNLFCGGDLSAALVPLYRAPALSDSPTGNAIDTNNGPFVSGDYTETGTSGGLNPGSSNSTKYLDTGLTPNGLDTLATGHLSAWHAEFTTPGAGNFRSMISVFGATTATQIYFCQAGGGSFNAYGGWGNPNPAVKESFTSTTPAAQVMITRTSSTDSRFYVNGSPGTTLTASSTPAALSQPWYVFANNNNGTTQRYWQAILRSYSIGRSMTDSQASAFYTAMNTFMQTLGRA